MTLMQLVGISQRLDSVKLDTVASVCERVQLTERWSPAHFNEFSVPYYRHNPGKQARVMLAYEPFARHMTDEGHQMQQGLALAGYQLYGPGYAGRVSNDAGHVSYQSQCGTMILQDQREWDSTRPGCFDKGRDFVGLEAVRSRHDIFRLCVHKDAHQDPKYHHISHRDFSPHAWIVYYHPRIVKMLCPWLREKHLVRTSHSLDPSCVPEYSASRGVRCLLSGSLSSYYPLRQSIARWSQVGALGDVMNLKHPGYHSRGSATPLYLQLLSQCRVAICTASKLGYSLRKMIEATACGCRVITNAPVDDPYVGIDGNMTRVGSDITAAELRDVIEGLVSSYDPELQRAFAIAAVTRYDYRAVGQRLADSIELLRSEYA